jgi:hypothetical protein
MSDEYSVFHGLVGVFVVCLAIIFHVGPIWTAAVVFVLGVAHEVYDGDLIHAADGAPYEGVKDVLSFLFPGPFLYLLWWGPR